MKFAVVPRPKPEPSSVGRRPPSAALLAFLRTARNEKAIRVPLNGRAREAIASTFRVATSRRPALRGYQVRTHKQGTDLVLWLRRRDGER